MRCEAIGDLATLGTCCGDDGILVADLGVRRVWSPQSEELFDIRGTDTDAQSYLRNHFVSG